MQFPLDRVWQLIAGLVAGFLLATSTPARAWSLELGAGAADFHPCCGDGGWKQPPLPYTEKMRTAQQRIALVDDRFELGLVRFGNALVAGTYTADANYDPGTHAIAPGAPLYRAEMVTRTDGLEIAWRPLLQPWLRLRAGALVYRQATDWSYQGLSIASHHEAGIGATPLVGLIAEQPLGKRFALVASVTMYERVKFAESPIGGRGPAHGYGAKSTLLSIRANL